MGTTIHYTLTQKKKFICETLDNVEVMANAIKENQADKTGVRMTVDRECENILRIDIEGCETLKFDFRTHDGWRIEAMEKTWSYEIERLKHLNKDYQDDKYVHTTGFCKTQYASKVICHKWVADLIKRCASFCVQAEVYDEGDYYHTGRLEDASEAIQELGAVIDGMAGDLEKKGFEIKVGGSTKIKSRKSMNPCDDCQH